MVWHRIRDERETIQSLLIPRREMDWITRTPIDRKKRLIRENEGKDKRKMKIQKRLKQENYLNRKNILIAIKKKKRNYNVQQRIIGKKGRNEITQTEILRRKENRELTA